MLCQEKKRPKGAAATICRIDLYIVGSRQIFAVKILDVVGRKPLRGQGIKKTNKLLISANFRGQMLMLGRLRRPFSRVPALDPRCIVQCACVLDH